MKFKNKKETYFRKEAYGIDGVRYYQTKEKANNGFYKITTRYSNKLITTEYVK